LSGWPSWWWFFHPVVPQLWLETGEMVYLHPVWDSRLAQLDAISERVRDNAKFVLNHAFLRAAGCPALLYLRFALPSPWSQFGPTLKTLLGLSSGASPREVGENLAGH
jgi:hypothetical protein